MYFNETNNTNIDSEFGDVKKNRKNIFKSKKSGSKKKFRFTQDTLLMFFYGLLLIVGIVLIIISVT